MLVCEWPPGLSLQDIDLKMSVFGVQIHGIPLELMTTPNAEKIVKKLGNLNQIEQVPSLGTALRRYMRIQVEINVENPVLGGFPLI